MLNYSTAKLKRPAPPTNTGRVSLCGASLSKGGCKDPAVPESHCPEEQAALPGTVHTSHHFSGGPLTQRALGMGVLSRSVMPDSL